MGNYPPTTSPILTECKNLLSEPKGSLRALKAFLDDRSVHTQTHTHSLTTHSLAHLLTHSIAHSLTCTSLQPAPDANFSMNGRAQRYKFAVGDGLSLPQGAPSPCYNVSSAAAAGPHGRVVCSDWSGCGSGLNAEIWDYQVGRPQRV